MPVNNDSTSSLKELKTKFRKKNQEAYYVLTDTPCMVFHVIQNEFSNHFASSFNLLTKPL